MSLETGDLTTPALAAAWQGGENSSNPKYALLVASMSRMLINCCNRGRLFSQVYSRTLDGVGNYQLQLPDYPVTSITSIQVGGALIPPAPLPPTPNYDTTAFSPGYGYRFIPWRGDLPGAPAMVEFVNGLWWTGAQNIKATYVAGYLISNEAHTVPASTPWQVTVQQPQGIWCLDNGVSYAVSGLPLVPVASAPTTGQYIPPTDSNLGVYTFSTGDANAAVLISYSYVPADLTEAANQMVAERMAYTARVGVVSKALGGQETVRFMRGGTGRGMFPNLPPEVEALIMPYVSVIPPGDIGAPV